MVLLCKQRALYVKACIIANGITDSQGDTLFAEDIKKIFTSFNNQDNFEIHHNDLPIPEVSLLENYISTADETIGTAVVPKGSWMAVIRVDNPDIQNGLFTGEFGGVSLNNRIAPRCQANLTGQVMYRDIADAECVIPLLISFVQRGANGYGLMVMDYDAYIKKSDTSKGAKKMAFDLLSGLKSLIEKAEASKDEDSVILKEEEDPKEDEEVEATAEEAPTEEDEPVVEKEDEPTTEEEDDEKSEEEAVIEKEDDEETAPTEESEEEAEIEKEDAAEVSLEERVAKIEEQLAELLKKDEPVDEVKEESEETTPEEDEEVAEDTPKITKSEKVMVEGKTIQHLNYYEMSGRDPRTGKKIRK